MSDITNKYIQQIATAPGSSTSAPIWVKGDKPSSANNKYSTLEEMQEDLKAQAAIRSPEYNRVVQNLYNGNFISRQQAGQAISVANALSYPVQMYQAYAKRAGGEAVSFNKWFDWYVSTSQPRDAGGGGSRGGGGYTGPQKTVTLQNEDDLRRMADQLSSQLVGRAVSDDEFKKALKRVRSAERENPTITTPSTGMTVSEAGLSAEGRQDILQRSLAKNPEAKDFTMATQMMSWFDEWLGGRPDARG
jgi:hypothetical protein